MWCSNATPRSNSACAGAEHETEKWTPPGAWTLSFVPWAQASAAQPQTRIAATAAALQRCIVRNVIRRWLLVDQTAGRHTSCSTRIADHVAVGSAVGASAGG